MGFDNRQNAALSKEKLSHSSLKSNVQFYPDEIVESRAVWNRRRPRATSTASSASLSLFLASEAEAEAEAKTAPACSKGERGDDPSRSSSGEIFWGWGRLERGGRERERGPLSCLEFGLGCLEERTWRKKREGFFADGS